MSDEERAELERDLREATQREEMYKKKLERVRERLAWTHVFLLGLEDLMPGELQSKYCDGISANLKAMPELAAIERDA